MVKERLSFKFKMPFKMLILKFLDFECEINGGPPRWAKVPQSDEV